MSVSSKRMVDVLVLDRGLTAADGARAAHEAFNRYVECTRRTNTVKDEVEFLLSLADTFGVFMGPLNSVVKRRDGRLGVVTGYINWPTGWQLVVKIAGGQANDGYDEVVDAKIPSELIEIAIGSRDTIKEKVHEKVEEAFA